MYKGIFFGGVLRMGKRTALSIGIKASWPKGGGALGLGEDHLKK